MEQDGMAWDGMGMGWTGDGQGMMGMALHGQGNAWIGMGPIWLAAAPVASHVLGFNNKRALMLSGQIRSRPRQG